MSDNNNSQQAQLILDPWNSSNKLLTERDIISIYERVGFKNVKQTLKINDLSLYQTAFVHSSYVRKCILENTKDLSMQIVISDKPEGAIELFEQHKDYENMEYLGDRVLELGIAYYIFRKYPETNQGFKTVLKTKLVRKNTLAKFAKFLDLPKHIIISRQVEEKTQQGRYNERILEDVMEAFICAIFLDQNKTDYNSETVLKFEHNRLIGPGFQVANAFIEKLLEQVIDFEELLEKEENYKEQLLQYYQKEFKITPEYISISIEGPPQQRIFTQGVLDKDGNIISRGVGKNKSEAEQLASLYALQYYGVIKK